MLFASVHTFRFVRLLQRYGHERLLQLSGGSIVKAYVAIEPGGCEDRGIRAERHRVNPGRMTLARGDARAGFRIVEIDLWGRAAHRDPPAVRRPGERGDHAVLAVEFAN